MYDMIGDIHGHADELVQLLTTLGYTRRSGVFQHPSRQPIFLGDFIDRGTQIRETLEIVRPMVEGGHALAVMGNHELNALAFHTRHPHTPANHLRPHNEKNSAQHAETVRQLSEADLASHLGWFRTLPLWLDLAGLRVVHACWDESALDQVADAKPPVLTDEFLHAACAKNQHLYDPVEILLKGKEILLPDGLSFRDKEGHQRHNTRVRWYLSPENQTYRTYAMATEPIPCDLPLEREIVQAAAPYSAAAKPVFTGHYWLTGERPELLAKTVACVDWSVATGGFLCAYRWNGERELQELNFVWVPARSP